MNFNGQKISKVITLPWIALLVMTLIVIIHPVGKGFVRLFLLLALPTLIIGCSCLLWEHKRLRIIPIVLCLIAGIFLILPGRPANRQQLRLDYVRYLKDYDDTTYVWGGENSFGIDCSGLVRNGLIKANTRQALTGLNPALAREALSLWWFDCTAKALKEKYRNMTSPLFSAESINAISVDKLKAGDIAVTSDGVHVLAYLGDSQWAEADPGLGKVVCLSTPTKNLWFDVPVHVLRWKQLED